MHKIHTHTHHLISHHIKSINLDLVEGDDVDGLHPLLERLDVVGDVVLKHKCIHNSAGHHQLHDTVGDGLQLVGGTLYIDIERWMC
jgi:hypothetical protein